MIKCLIALKRSILPLILLLFMSQAYAIIVREDRVIRDDVPVVTNPNTVVVDPNSPVIVTTPVGPTLPNSVSPANPDGTYGTPNHPFTSDSNVRSGVYRK